MNNLEIRLFKNWWLLLLKGMLILIYGGIFIASFWVSLLNTAPNYKVLIYTYIFISIINGVLILFGTFFYRNLVRRIIFCIPHSDGSPIARR